MATEPTPEQSACEILYIFIKHFNLGPGGTLRINSFNAVWPSRGLRFEDLQLGIEFAKAQGWIIAHSNGTLFELTQSGFARS